MFDDLKRAVLARREELDLSQLDVWAAGGPSNTTLTKIEGWEPGEPEPTLSRPTFRKLDKALRWVPGSARAALREGRAPIPLPEDGLGSLTDSEVQKLREVIGAAPVDDYLRRRLLGVIDEEEGRTG